MSLALTVSVQFGKEEVIAHVGIYLAYGQHIDVAVGITVYEHGRAGRLSCSANIHGMVPVAVGCHHNGVVQRPGRTQAVHPWLVLRKLGKHFSVHGLLVAPLVVSRFQREVEHVDACRSEHNDYQRDECREE